MADITIRLIWYRLGETYSKMAEAGANMTSWFNWEDHFLDFLLVFWISGGLVVVGVINSLTQFFGPLQPRISWDRSKDGATSVVSKPQGPAEPETTLWLNSALNWFYLHYNHFPAFVDAWIASLNAQANKLGVRIRMTVQSVDGQYL